MARLMASQATEPERTWVGFQAAEVGGSALTATSYNAMRPRCLEDVWIWLGMLDAAGLPGLCPTQPFRGKAGADLKASALEAAQIVLDAKCITC
jgi:hypothetical protein